MKSSQYHASPKQVLPLKFCEHNGAKKKTKLRAIDRLHSTSKVYQFLNIIENDILTFKRKIIDNLCFL